MFTKPRTTNHECIQTNQNYPENEIIAPRRIMWCGMQFYDKKTAPALHPYLFIYFILKNIIYINNLKLYEVSGQFSVSAFQFHVKKTSFWLNTKIKVQNIIHFSISHFHCHKIKSSKVIYIYIYIWVGFKLHLV